MKLQEDGITDKETYEETDSTRSADNTILIRYPCPADGQQIWQLVRDSGVLDPNSVYCYLLLCEHFRETCRVAEQDGKVMAFVTAYKLPTHNNTLFIWQIGTAAEVRGRGIAKKLVLELLASAICNNINILQATISPSNTASMALFRSIAKHLNTSIDEREYFAAELFPGMQHEKENLITVGPFNP